MTTFFKMRGKQEQQVHMHKKPPIGNLQGFLLVLNSELTKGFIF